MVRGDRVVSLDRRKNITLNEGGVKEKFGVAPESIPDYLALVGDAADGIPGVPRWGAKSASTVLASYMHIEDIPDDPVDWTVAVRGAKSMADNLASHHDDALLYKRLATLRLDVPITETLHDLEWQGVRRKEFEALCQELGFTGIVNQVGKWDEG